MISGQQRQLANTAVLEQPPADAPILMDAYELSSTSATATAAAPIGTTYSRESPYAALWKEHVLLCSSEPDDMWPPAPVPQLA